MTDGVNSGDEASDRKKGLFARFKKGQPGKGQSEQPAPVEKEVVSAAVVTTDVATEVTEKASETGGDDGGSNVAGVFDAEKAVSAELGFSEEQSLSIKMASDPVKVVSVDTASNIEE